MAVVADANLLVAVAIDDTRGPTAQQTMLDWAEAEEEVHVPSLALYEVASAFTGMLAAGTLSTPQVRAGAAILAALPIVYYPLEDIPGTVAIASRLQRRSAYYAAYIRLAQLLGAELWTFDSPLARNAASVGFPVRLLTVAS